MADDDRSDWVWLAFPGGGPPALFPPASVPMWRGKGWVDSEAPPEPNVLKDPEPEPIIDTSALGDPQPPDRPSPDASDFTTPPTDEPEE